MTGSSAPWVVVLAAGEGTRLRSMTRLPNGEFVPKQFCRFGQDESLLERTIRRARRLSDRERIVVIVAQGHERHWADQLRDLPAQNIIVQPQNRGTAAGLLLPLMHVMRRDSDARIVILPSDHAFDDEDALDAALRSALRGAARRSEVVLLGMEPEAPETGFGWIVPGAGGDEHGRPIARFIEKPSAQLAAQLMYHGALWSSFVMAGRATSFGTLFASAQPRLLVSFLENDELLEQRDGVPSEVLSQLYESMPVLDFSRDVLEACRGQLRLVGVPACGWSDLGTPERVMDWLARRRVGSALASRTASQPAALAAAQLAGAV
jgi:mannose-1-phosphate guanylyltransferase